MEKVPSFIGLAVGLVIFVVALAFQRRPKIDGQVRYVPWLAVMFAGLLIAVVFARHLVTLMRSSDASSDAIGHIMDVQLDQPGFREALLVEPNFRVGARG